MEQYLPVPAAVLTAIQTGDIEQLRFLYNPDIELEAIAKYAAKENQAQVLEWCYAKGWTPSTDDLNEPFFIAAICNPSIEFWQVLLNHGYDMNAYTTETLGDALASAVMFGEHDFAKWLLEHGHKVNPREPTIQPECSIARAVRGDAASIDMLRALLDHGFELAEYGAATAAVEEENVEALKLLLAHGGFDVDEVVMWWYPFDDERDEPTDSEAFAGTWG
ncbi:hypothetical protein E8E13_001564 [Curvularia kusanoi]|uniref:Ankyrin repeat domain-containing protein n=1 Tax=Curvularia kusanoi TaxID=90978 RepID=A0A9P4TEI6_CURKU|nr:hypothetical protein E8E13_001564 [Curvularia kusanoi]